MRGTGYAISEILIFLAIAGIIGFLLGWVVFRRTGTAGDQAQLDTTELKRAEERVKALEAMFAKTERRADAVVAATSKAAALTPAAGSATAAAATAPAVGDKQEKVRPKKGPEGGKPTPDKEAPEPAKAQAPKEEPKKAPEPTKAQAPKEEPKPDTGDEELDEYLSDADKRIQKLEQTLDRLRGKLDDLEG